MRSATRNALVIAAAFAILTPAPARSQSLGFLSGLGYATAGGAIGVAATANATCEGFLCIPDAMVAAMLAGVIGGAITGAAINSSAQRKIDSGKPLGGGHLAALSVGTVLGGATLGAIASGLIVNSDGSGTFLGSDERTFAIMTAAGAGLGVIILRKHWGRLTGRGVQARPAILNGGRPGVVASIRF